MCLIIASTALLLSSACTTPKTVRYTKKLKGEDKTSVKVEDKADDELYLTNANDAESKKIQEFERLLGQAKSRKKTDVPTPSKTEYEYEYDQIKAGENQTIEQKKRRLPTLREQVVDMNKKTGSIEGRIDNIEKDVTDIKRSVNDIKTAIIRYNSDKNVASNYNPTKPKLKPKLKPSIETPKKPTVTKLVSQEEKNNVPIDSPKVENNQITVSNDNDFVNGEKHFNNNEFSKATTFLTMVIRKQRSGNEAGKAHYYLGKINYEQKNYNQAISHLKRALTITGIGYKDNAQALLAESYIRSGNPQMAKQAYQSLIEKYPQSKYVPKARKMLQQL